MKLINSITKRLDRWLKVEFDKESGFYKHKRFGKYVYIRHPGHIAKESDILWVCENLFFKHYLPSGDDVVVDLGAGYGDEAIYVYERSPGVTYIAVEAQPVIYECLCNTFRWLGKKFIASPFVITGSGPVRFVSHFSYASVGDIPEGYIDIPTLSWHDFLDRYSIERIDLMKMNIEGAEKEILQAIDDFSIIRRFAISCHDFRANAGDGEWFRTKSVVTRTLQENGYRIKPYNYGIDFADDWVYAERVD